MGDHEHPNEGSKSPNGSKASQTSSQSNLSRIVKLLPESVRQDNGNNVSQEDWTIRAEFYDEDIVAADEEMSDYEFELDEQERWDGDEDEDEFEFNDFQIGNFHHHMRRDLDVSEVFGADLRLERYRPQFPLDEFDHQDELLDYDRIREVFNRIERLQPNERAIQPERDVADFDEDDIMDLDFVIGPDIGGDSDSNEDIDEDIELVDYDITLPVNHQYLGDDLQESGSTQIFAENSLVKLPLFNLKHIVLLPGQRLPITTLAMSSRIHRSLKVYIAKGISIIGLMSDSQTNSVGTTAEIRNFSEQQDQVRLILEGRQRFKLASQPFESVVEGTVKILPEVTLGRPYLVEPSCRRFLSNKISKPAQIIPTKRPMWLLKKYESANIIKKILEQIKDWCKIDPTTKEPSDFSYWVASNLPLSNHERMKVLRFDCTEQRLLWLLETLVKNTSFACATCKSVICSKEEVFPMSCTGPQNSFVNSGGFVHDTLTVRNVTGLFQEQTWSSEFSWFPGYLWRIACCHHCGRHIGWCYKSISQKTKPRRFFGLSRANVRLAESSGTQESRRARDESTINEAS